MKPIISPWLMYFILITDNILSVCTAIIVISILGIFILWLVYGMFAGDKMFAKESDFWQSKAKWWTKITKIPLIISIILIVFVPSKSDIFKIIIANNLTANNISAGVEVINSALDNIFDRVDELLDKEK